MEDEPNSQTYRKFESALVAITTSTNGSWNDKRDILYNQLTQEGKDALFELLEWFEGFEF